LAESQILRRANLSGYGAIPAVRNLRSNVSDQESRRFSFFQYREGQGRLTSGEFLHFLGQARGSLLELETQLAIALDLNYLKPDQHEVLDDDAYQVLDLLKRLIESLRKKPLKP
jgi:23S rRNA-intervening sequence protein